MTSGMLVKMTVRCPADQDQSERKTQTQLGEGEKIDCIAASYYHRSIVVGAVGVSCTTREDMVEDTGMTVKD